MKIEKIECIQKVKQTFDEMSNKYRFVTRLIGYKVNGKIIVPINKKNPTFNKVLEAIHNGMKPIPQYTKESLKEYVKNELKNRLNTLCDVKSQEAIYYVSGSKVSQSQLDRYYDKYKVSLAYLKDGSKKEKLQLEADLQGISVDDLAKLVVKLHDEYVDKIETLNNRIESFRIAVKKIIEAGEIDKAIRLIDKAQKFNANTSDEDIKELFNEI